MAASPVLTATKDNSAGQLASGIASNGLSIILGTGEGASFPQPYHGTCTSLGSSATLNCTGISATIGGSAQVGKPIRNFTDGSWAFILSVSTDSLTTTALQGGSDNTWQNSDQWRIDEFVITLEKHDSPTPPYNVTHREKVLIYGRSTDTLQVYQAADRGFDGSTAQAFDADDYVYLEVVSYTIRKIIEQCSELSRLIDSNLTSISNLNKAAPFYAADTGAADAYAVTLSPAPTAYSAGQIVTFLAAHDNTTTSTLNVNGLGTKTIKKLDGATNLTANDIRSGQLVFCAYDGTNFVMLSPSGAYTGSLSSIAFYGTGIDGALNVTSGTTSIDCASQSVVIKNYSSINISVGATVNFTNVPDEGVLVVFLSTGNVTIAGTLDLSGKGSKGAVSISVSRTSTGNSSSNGVAATEPVNNAQQLRGGQAGNGFSATAGGQFVNAAGGSGGANAVNGSSATSAAGSAGATAAGANGAVALTAALSTIISTVGLRIGPGGGGAVGAVAVGVESYSTGTFSATSGDAGRGGGGLLICCGGTFTHTGTINLSGTAASAPSKTFGTISPSTNKAGVAAAGSGGGSSGTGLAIARTIGTVSGTKTVTGGAFSSGTTQVTSPNAPDQCNATDGTNGGAGSFVVVQSY